MPRYLPLFWRIFIPNATVLAVASVVLVVQPANGRVLVLATGLATLLAVNLVIMRRAFRPLSELADVMQDIDPLRPGQRVPVPGPLSEVTLVASAFNDMLDRLELERRESARRELHAQQAVRRHVARELHDQLGQDLTALGLQLDRMAMDAPPEIERSAAQARDAALASVETVRRLARQLRPEVLDDLGLRPALVDLCHRIATQTGLRVDTELSAVPEGLDQDTELVVYRVVQESLTNVLRHAEASRSRVVVSMRGGELEATITDDGVGMRGDGRVGEGGLRQMLERVLLVGGRLDVDSAPGRGTTVRLRVPVAP